MATQEKYLLNCQEGTHHVERATISLVLATMAFLSNGAQEKTK